MFWWSLLGATVGGALGFLLAEIIRRFVRKHERLEQERNQQLAFVVAEIEHLREMSVSYWLDPHDAENGPKLQASILGRFTPLNEVVIELFRGQNEAQAAGTDLMASFFRACTEGPFLEPTRERDESRLREIEHFAASATVRIKRLRASLPRRFLAG